MAKKNLLVTFADKKFIPQIKQVFSSAHHKGGWDGDYMILTPDIEGEDAKWFIDRGIIVNKQPIPFDVGGLKKFPATIYLIFYIFTQEFKKWQHVLYLDVDVIIRADLSALTKVKGFAAAPEVFNNSLKHQFYLRHLQSHDYAPSKYTGISFEEHKKKYKELKQEFNLRTVGFNAGIFVVNTDIINQDTFSNLVDVYKRYGRIISFPPQGELNLFFYNNWEKLPLVYNSYVFLWHNFYKVPLNKLDGILLHLVQAADKNIKPWDKESPFYQEWRSNLDLADSIDINHPKKPSRTWSEKEVQEYCDTISSRQRFFDLYLRIDRQIGLLALWLKRISPSLYQFLRKLFKKNG